MADHSEDDRACGALASLRDEICSRYARALRRVGPHYATRPWDELLETAGQATDAYLAVLCSGDWGPMDRFIGAIARRRFTQRFPMSEVQRAFTVFRELCHPELTSRVEGGGLDDALSVLDRTVDEAIHRFSDTYQQLHLDEMNRQAAQLAEAHTRLRKQYRAVEEAARIKGQFYANMGHELRSPLNAILGYTELLLDGIDGPVTEEQRRDLERIVASSRYLLKLINNILDMARFEAGRVEVDARPFDVGAVVVEARDTVAPLALRKDLDLHVEVPGGLRFTSDPDKVKQILINLLANAVKFTPRGKVACTVRREGDELVLEVRDTGIGIAPEDRERVFEKFYQANRNVAGEYRGTGLGLPLCRLLAEVLGGEIGLESEVGHGSRFWVRLPESPPAAGGVG